MDLSDVMAELETRVGTVSGIRTASGWPGQIQPPTAIVTFPEVIEYDQTYGRGMDRMTLFVVVAVSRADNRAGTDKVSALVKGSGAGSVKAALESGTPTSFHTATVTEANFDTATIAGTSYLTVTFTVEITGTGG
jgi:hypothetical protein